MTESLTRSAEQGDVSGVQRALEQGAPVDYIANGRFNETPLQVSARAGRLDVVKLLLASGANVNHVDHDGFSPVTAAARAGKWEVVKVLAEQGGDFGEIDGYGKSGCDYLKRCRNKRRRAEIEAVLAGLGPVRPA